MKRISKAAARKMWNNNQDFIMVPCKLSPNGFGSVHTRCDLLDEEKKADFDKLVNEFEFYNCNRETGKYMAFYVEE